MKILLVDDSSFINLFCRHTLVQAGHEILGEAYDGTSAIQMALDLAPDLVLMDIALPEKNGFEATQAILEKLPHTKILGISALDEDWVKERAIESGCVDFLAKPFTALQLIDQIEKIFEENKDLKYG